MCTSERDRTRADGNDAQERDFVPGRSSAAASAAHPVSASPRLLTAVRLNATSAWRMTAMITGLMPWSNAAVSGSVPTRA